MIAWRALWPRVSARIFASLCALLLLAVVTNPEARAQSIDDIHIVPRSNPPEAEKASADPDVPARPLHVDVNLVLVPVTVTDPMNHPVVSLQKQDFTLYEGTVQQQIRYFSHEDAPISVGLVLDCSASMKNKIEYERQALEEFFNNANSEDEYFAVTVSDKPQLIATASDSFGTLQDRLASSPPKGHTALFDAIYLAISKMRTARYARRALLIISDGGDNTSRYTRDEIRKVIEESDVLTYAIGIFDDELPLLKTFEERMGRDWLSELTDASGGRTLAADNREKIPEIAAIVSRELRNEYVLGYRPMNLAHDGTWRKMTVKVAQPSESMRLHVHYRQRYRAPTQ
ncbi:MAG TPA: VWA domain-containing protein [Candidatus Binatia bacterium]|nr:VWA domain-containing protein [Candidatus Binatia bacterium]